MPVSFAQIVVGESYSRNKLAELWGYASIHALARGVVTPKDDNKIILFVTREKQSGAEQYKDELSEGKLHWEGPTDHFAEDRILATATSGDEVHLFYRERHHTEFINQGRLEVVSCERHTDRPSRFVFRIR
jgi:putative restriction endonuclease